MSKLRPASESWRGWPIGHSWCRRLRPYSCYQRRCARHVVACRRFFSPELAEPFTAAGTKKTHQVNSASSLFTTFSTGNTIKHSNSSCLRLTEMLRRLALRVLKPFCDNNQIPRVINPQHVPSAHFRAANVGDLPKSLPRAALPVYTCSFKPSRLRCPLCQLS